MKLLRSIGCILFIFITGNICIGQVKGSGETQIPSLGGYWFVMYSKGVNWSDSATKRKIDQVHINYIIGFRKAGKIITGGAFTDKVSWTGFEIYNCKTKEEVIKITERDPMVLSKIFSYDIHPWVTLKGAVKFE